MQTHKLDGIRVRLQPDLKLKPKSYAGKFVPPLGGLPHCRLLVTYDLGDSAVFAILTSAAAVCRKSSEGSCLEYPGYDYISE